MKKQLLIGLAIGFGAMFLWNKSKNKCSCEEDEGGNADASVKASPEKPMPSKPMTECEKYANEQLKLMKRQFASDEAKQKFFNELVQRCLKSKQHR